MGMAASQGRFLSLTARKSNTEYEGQQVNQQRMLLANQTAALNSQMLALNVPTPPDANQYYNDQYVFEDGDKDFEIISGLGRDSVIVRESVTSHRLYSQPVNMGNPVVLTMLENKLRINNQEMTLLSENSSRNQIRNILDNGQAADLEGNHYFMCNGDLNGAGTGYTRVNDNPDKLSDNSVLKYINDYSEVSLPIADDSNFERNYYKGVPSYYLKEDVFGNKTFLRLNSDNYNTLMRDALDNPNVRIVQEVRDDNNKPVKKAISQSECELIEGLNFYTADNVKKNWEKVDDPSSASQKYLYGKETPKDELMVDTGLAQKLENNLVVLFKQVEDSSEPSGVRYERINNIEELEALEDDAVILKVVDPEQNSGNVPTEGEIIDPSLLVPIYIDNNDTSDYGNVPFYTYTEEIVDVPTGAFALTQEMWDRAKENGDTELMNYYIESLDFSDDSENAKNNYLYYYVNDSMVHYLQSSRIPNSLFDGTSESEQLEIGQEFYEHSYDEYIDQTFTGCVWNKDNSSGRYVTMTGKNEAGITKTYNLVYTRVKDDDAYDQALMDYEYRKAEYDKKISDINAKTSTIQQQDKTLELRLKSLDTEQDALAKEMEAIQKVIQNNVEKTFNTFG